MQPIQSKSRNLVFWLALGLAFFSAQACSEGGGKVTLPKDAQIVLTVGQDGNLTVLDTKGMPVPKCQLCTQAQEQKYGPYCKDAPPKSGICAGLTGVTVQKVQPVTFIDTHKNPRCRCTVIGGDAFCIPTGCNTQ